MTRIDDNPKSDASKDAINPNAKGWKLELSALIGFCISGAIFILSGIKNRDFFTIFGSCVWIGSCIVWMIPYRKYFGASRNDSDC